jgi:tetratricopeptide (TPR) repeat protein
MKATQAKPGLYLLFVALALLAFPYGCDRRDGDTTVGKNNTSTLTDKPLAAFQKKLLDLAFETATLIPVHPHIKDRSRAQEAVVATCLELDQPKRALGFIRRIDNWRRGLCYANLAFYCVEHGGADEAQRYLKRDGDIASGDIEEWRSDRITVRIAQTHALLGEMQKADELGADLEASESGKVARIKAMLCEEDSFDEQMAALDEHIASGHLDQIRNSLQAYAQLFGRFYADEKKRSLVEEKIMAAWSAVPVFVRLELLMELAGFALDHADQSEALELVNEAQLFMDKFQWRSEHRITRIAELIKLRFRAGDVEKARTDADEALALFNAQRDKIVNIYRAGALRPLAEAYQAMGDTEAALSVYKQAVEEGVENPNSRPRAEDLSATCCSMALYAVEPDVELWERIRGIHHGLGDPW